MSCKVHYFNRSTKKRYDLTPVVSEAEVFGTVDNLYRTARIEVIDRQKVKYENSERIRVYAEGKLIFDGRIFSVRNSARSGVTLMCFDNAYYFRRFMANMIYRPVGQKGNEKGVKLSDMIRRLARQANVEVDYIERVRFKHRLSTQSDTLNRPRMNTEISISRTKICRLSFKLCYLSNTSVQAADIISR